MNDAVGVQPAHIRIFSAIDRAIAVGSQVAMAIACGAILVLLVVGTADVVGTQIFGRAVPSAIELQESFAAILIFSSFVIVQRQRAHLVVDLITERLAPRGRRWAELFSLACTIAVFALLSLQSYALAARSVGSLEESPGFIGFPVYPFKVVAAIAGVLVLLEALRQFLRLLLDIDKSTRSSFNQRDLAP